MRVKNNLRLVVGGFDCSPDEITQLLGIELDVDIYDLSSLQGSE